MATRPKLACLLFFCTSFAPIDGRYWAAGEALIKNLRAQSPAFEGVAMRDYTYKDLDNDNVYEIIETVNKLEEGAPGWLNSEISPAFDLHRVYNYKAGKFQKDYRPFAEYVEQRIEFYKFWKRQIQNSSLLSEDSQELVKANKQTFIKELDRLIAAMEGVKNK
ncbi:hypothetical protein J4D99_14590 [Siccationidurans ginsengisoli]|uniref:hypothetical protein n=1 Tax=Hymenobacter ginsengisoli TaxID=1051626 RepID=UPI001AC8D8DC|nr:hypothetical protein [Hymenobacter sp. BT559]